MPQCTLESDLTNINGNQQHFCNRPAVRPARVGAALGRLTDPLLAIFTVMVGGAIGGIIGIYLSIPIAAALRVVYRNLASPKNVLSRPDAVNEHLTVTSTV